ncbi:retrovirus-related Pol polyprotein from transposon opus [Trichonephila clavipes]|nr:retrovirus-related Pol polyprotein from transposon opus [Trichonephila clavipes]
MGPKKTLERIKYSFFWEGLRADVKKFCESCKECQLTRSVRIKDRSSSTPVARPELPFEVGYMDLIGPIDPPSLKGHKYIFRLVDQHTRKSTNQHFVAVEPILDDLHDCSRSALIYSLFSAPERRHDVILAKGSTGIELTCDIILDFPHKIELTSNTDELAVESSDIMTIVAKDKLAMLAKNFKKYFLDEDNLVASYEWIRDLFQDTPEELSTSEEIFLDLKSSEKLKGNFVINRSLNFG